MKGFENISSATSLRCWTTSRAMLRDGLAMSLAMSGDRLAMSLAMSGDPLAMSLAI